MIITYHGKQCFKLQQGQTVIGINVFSHLTGKKASGKAKKQKPPRFRADILLASLIHPDFAPDGIMETELHSEKDPFVIVGPGQYEVKDVVVKGYLTDADYQGVRHNSFFIIEWEGLRITVLGALGSGELPVEVKEVAVDSDIWITPIGGNGLLEAEEAYKLAVKMEPSVIIPCHFDNGNGPSLKHFLESGGLEKAKPQDKLTVKKKDLAGRTGDIVVLNPQ